MYIKWPFSLFFFIYFSLLVVALSGVGDKLEKRKDVKGFYDGWDVMVKRIKVSQFLTLHRKSHLTWSTHLIRWIVASGSKDADYNCMFISSIEQWARITVIIQVYQNRYCRWGFAAEYFRYGTRSRVLRQGRVGFHLATLKNKLDKKKTTGIRFA